MTTAEAHIKTVTVVLDQEQLAGVAKHTTPDAVLRLAGLDPATHYLVRVKGRHQESFEGLGGEEITVHEQEVFVSVSTGPTPTA
jgi:hypothetical protein